MKQNFKRKLMAGLLSVCMMFQTVGIVPVYAVGNAADSGLPIDTSSVCTHHVHDENCGYTEGTPCTHEHTDECSAEVTKCVHEHTADCYPVQDSGETTGSDAKEPTACTHICSAESGCITKELACKHVHDDTCGYKEGTPCTFDPTTCESCKAKNTADADNIGTLAGEVYAVWDGSKFCAATAEAPTVPTSTEITNKKIINNLYIMGGSVPARLMQNCTKLKTVICADTVTGIEQYAFSACTGLTSVEMPSVTTIATYGFKQCPIKSIEMPNVTSINKYAFYSCGSLTSVAMPKVTSIGDTAFKSCANLTSVEMPKVATIAFDAFFGCTGLTSANMPKVTSIGNQVFNGCTNLASLTLGATPPTVGTDAFTGCPITRTLIIQGNTAFQDAATALAAYKTADDGDPIDDKWWGWTLPAAMVVTPSAGTLEITTGNSNPNVGAENTITLTATFDKATKVGKQRALTINQVEFKDGINTLGTIATATQNTDGKWEAILTVNTKDWAVGEHKLTAEYAGNHELGGIISNTVTVTVNESYAVYDGSKFCKATADAPTVPTTTEITDKTIINNLYIMGEIVPVELMSGWYTCANLKTVICADTVTTIGNNAFKDCTSLASVAMPKVTTIGEYAFFQTALTSVAMPEATKIDKYAFSKTALTSVSMPKATKIGDSAFSGCTKLTSVSMPNATTIVVEAFYGCIKLASVAMPKVTKIGGGAFADCSDLTSLTLGATPPTVGENAFLSCPTSRTLTIQGNTAYATEVLAAYNTAAASDGAADNLWYGWTLPTSLDGTGVSTSEGKLTATGKSTSDFGQDNTITLTATFDKATKAGKQRALTINQVEFKDGINTLGAVTAAKNTDGKWEAILTVNTKDWAVGDHTLTAEFAGNHELLGASTTNEVTVTVNESYAVYDGNKFCRATKEAPSTATTTVISDKKTINHLYIMGASVPDKLMGEYDNLCLNLKTVTCANTVTTIGNRAFFSCKGLTNISLPSATTIGSEAFYGCKGLTSVELPSAITIGSEAFSDCTGLESVVLQRATSIGRMAFNGCTVLTSVKAPGATTIVKQAFEKCTSLASLTLGATSPTVGENAFLSCPTSRTLTIQGNPAYATEVLAAYNTAADGDTADNLWYGWTLPTTLDGTGVSNSAGTLTATGKSTSDFGQDNTITLTATFDKAEKIGKQRALTINQVEFKDGINTLGTIATAAQNTDGKWAAILTVNTKDWAVGDHTLTAEFAGNHELLGASTTNEVTVTVNESYAVYDGSKFCRATKEAPSTATTTVISDKNTISHLYVMGESVPRGLMGDWQNPCPNLKTVICADTVTTIGTNAFQKCKNLVSVAMPNVTTIGKSAFYYCESLASVAIPKVKAISASVFVNCKALASVDVSGATAIGDEAFSDCIALASVAMPNATTIGKSAFSDCAALASVAMPKVTSISDSAFWGCTSLTSFTLGATPPATVGTDVFYGCPTSTLTIQGNTAFKDTVLADYKAAADGDTADNLWWDWTLPTTLDGTGVSTSAGTLTATGKSTSDFGQDNTITLTATFDKAEKIGKQRALTINQVEFKDGINTLGAVTAAQNTDGKWAAILTVNTKDWAVGDHTLTAEFAGNHELGGIISNTVTVTINKIDQAALSIGGVPNKVTYGDSDFPLSTTGGNGTGGVTYAVTAGDAVSVTLAGEVTVLNAGTATITATKASDTNYNDATATTTIIVNAAVPTIAWTDAAAAETLPYTGSMAWITTTPTVTLVNGEPFNGTIQYAYKKTGLFSLFTGYTDGLPTAAGEYTIKAKIAAEGNYTEAESTNTMALTISHADNSIINRSTRSMYYGESFLIEYEIANTDTTQPTFTCEYKERSAAESTYTTTLPTNAGEYTMRVSATATQNYNACSAEQDFVINKAPLNVTDGTAEPKKWDGTKTATVTGLTFKNEITHKLLEGNEKLAIGTDFIVTNAEYATANVGMNIIKATVALQNTTKANNYFLPSENGGVFPFAGSPIALADGPDAPTFSAMDDEKGKDTFTFNSTNATVYEYSKNSGATWTEITASGATTSINVGNVALVAGELQVRVKATITHNASGVLANTAAQVFTVSIDGSVFLDKTTDVTYGDTITATVSGQQSGAALKYQWKADNVAISGATANTLNVPGSAVGKTITVEVTATGYEGNLISSATSAVAKKAVTATAGTVSKVYDGTAAVETADRTLTITKVNAGDDITITAANAVYNDASVNTNKAITLGDLSISGTAADWYDVTASTTVTGEITAKEMIDATVTVGGTYTYTGSAITPTAENVTVKDGTTTLVNGTDYGYDASNNTNAGTATVTVTLKGNYFGTASKTFIIAKADPSYSIPTGLTAKYGQTLSAVNIGATTDFSWMDDTTNVGAAGAQTHKARFTPNDTTNYNIVNDIDVTVTVEKAAPTVAVTAEKKVSFFSLGNHDDTITLKATVTGVTGGTVPTGTITFKSGATTISSAVEVTNGVATYEWVNPNAAKHTITAEFAATADTNYGNATGTSTAFDIDKAEQKELFIGGVPNKVTYGDNNVTLSATGGSGTGAVTYAVTAGSDVVSVTSAGKVTVLKVGTATITATKASDTNYNDATAITTITVNAATPTLTWGTTEQSTTYTGSPVLASVLTAPTVTLVNGEPFNGTIQYAYKETGLFSLFTGYTDGLPTVAGKYTIKAHIAAEGNYTAADSTTMELTINKSTPSLTISTMNGKTYDGTAVAKPTAGNMAITGANYADLTFAYSKNSDMSSPLTAAPKDAGTYYVQASVVAGDNTNAASSEAVSFTITKASASGISQEYPVVKTLAKDYTFDLSKLLPSIPFTQEYGSVAYAVASTGNANSVLTAVPTNSDIVNGKLTLNVANVADKDQTATVSISITTDNFTVTNAVITVKTVDKTPLMISNVTMAECVYNGSAYAYAGTPTFTNTTDNKVVTGVSFTTEYEGRNGTSYTKSETAPTNAGEYNLILTVSGSSADTYAGTLTVPFAITQKQVTVKAKDKDILAGAEIPSLSAPALNTDYTVAGFIGNDTMGGTVSMGYTGTPDNTKHGSYPITISGGTASDNYIVKYETGTLTISIDVSLITAAITAANNAKDGIAIYDTAVSSVAYGTEFVTTAEMTILNTAIQTATDAKAICTTLAQVQAAVKALDGAVANFKTAIKTGTYIAPSGGSNGSTKPAKPTTPDVPSVSGKLTWENKDGVWKLKDADGKYATGWQKVNGQWYYMNSDAVMQKGWTKVGDTWYYLKDSGAMQTGWLKVGDTWYYLKDSGAMQTGWLKVGDTWYYLKSSGAMATGWNWIGGKCYYLNSDGKMAVNTTIGGYKVDASGAWVK